MVPFNCQANFKKGFEMSPKKKCKLGPFPLTGLEQINSTTV